MEAQTSAVVENFSLVSGGPFYNLQSRWGRIRQERRWVVRKAVVLTVVSWVPLFVLSLAQGQAYNPHLQIPFLRDYMAYSRFLIALPILVVAEFGIDRKLRQVVMHFVESGLVQANELRSFEDVIRGIERLLNQTWPEVLMVVIAYAPSLKSNMADIYIGGVTSWHTIGTGAAEKLSYAGWWFVLVSVPLFRFLLLRWLWRITLWALFIWRTTHLKLHLVPTHPDLAAGLGFLSEAQKQFAPIVFAGGAVMSGGVANAILYEGATLQSARSLLITYVIFASLALVAPLFMAMPTLVRIRKDALFEVGTLTTAHDQAFHSKWIGPASEEGAGMLGNPDASSLADLSHALETVEDMRTVPLDKRTFIALAFAAALPMLPVILISTPADELIRDVLKMLG